MTLVMEMVFLRTLYGGHLLCITIVHFYSYTVTVFRTREAST